MRYSSSGANGTAVLAQPPGAAVGDWYIPGSISTSEPGCQPPSMPPTLEYPQ